MTVVPNSRFPTLRRAATRALVVALALTGCAGGPAPVAVTPDPAPRETATWMPYGHAVAARFPPPPLRYLTPGLAPGRSTFTSDDELRELLGQLAASPAPGVSARVVEAGRSQRGVPLVALLLTRESGATPEALARSARPTVLLVGQQHGDEPAPGEALLVLAQELARGRLAPLLDRINVAVMPRANPDGALAGRRVLFNTLDVNRDHLLLRTPEAQALALLTRDLRPALVIDAHEYTVVGRYLDKFDAVQRFDVLLQYAMTANLPPALSEASERRFHQPLREALAREGLAAEWYYTTSTNVADRRVSMGGVQPDTGRNVNGLKNAVSFLVETRGVGIGRLHLMRRVHTHVVAAESLLRSAAREPDALLAVRRQVEADVAGQACRGEFVVEAAATPTRYALTLLDPETGADKVVDVDWHSSLQLRPLKTRARPCGYWLAADATAVVERLRWLGAEVRRFAAPATLQAERWRETARAESARADVRGTIADAATVLRVQVALDPQALEAPAGSWYVPLDQPLANLLVAAFEPDTQNGWYANRLLDSLQQAARVMAPPAARFEPAR